MQKFLVFDRLVFFFFQGSYSTQHFPVSSSLEPSVFLQTLLPISIGLTQVFLFSTHSGRTFLSLFNANYYLSFHSVHGILQARILELPFPSPVDHVLSELFLMTHPFWVALSGMVHSFTELYVSPFTMTRLWSKQGEQGSTEESDGPQSMGSQSAGHDLGTEQQ